jgi:N-acetylglucosamine-6-sulfatase
LAVDLKRQLADTRVRVGDDGSHYPACETIVQEFWDYDKVDQDNAREISHHYLQRRLDELKAGKRNIRTFQGNAK